MAIQHSSDGLLKSGLLAAATLVPLTTPPAAAGARRRETPAIDSQPKKLPLGLIFKEGTLAQELHVSVRTIQRSLQTLVDAGRLRIKPRVRPDGGAPSNRYFPTWRPAPVAQPTPARAPLTLPIPNENEPAQEAVKIAPDTVFVWPTL